MRTAFMFCVGCSVCATAGLAANPVWLIGGGPDVFGAQAQIESNTAWARQVIMGLPGERAVRVWFNDGEDPAPDVSEWRPPPESAAALQPLARVMDSHWGNGLRYRNHHISGVVGGTRYEPLIQALTREIARLRAGARAWLVFNGHGRREADLNNTIGLWDRTWLHADELADRLDQAPHTALLRFIFTQCYAGSFARLARPGTRRCGFLAEAAEQQAEGCSAAINTADYEDYSTHFFAALAGADRQGGALARDPDRNADGRVTPLEAHYYTLLSAGSADIPRATSEVLLERWQPWYLGLAWYWFADGDNIYGELARALMRGAEIGDAADILQRRRRWQDRRRDLEDERHLLERDTAALRGAMESEVLGRWPASGYPYTLAYRQFLEQDLDQAQNFILAHPDYPTLVRLQDTYGDLKRQLLVNERELVRLDKIEHLLRLGRVLSILRALGPRRLQERYDDLLLCEDESF